MSSPGHKSAGFGLALGALGVVFGDIGTSPLYAIKESFHRAHGHQLQPTPENVTGLLSLVFWSLLLVVCVKYLWVVMRADNDGEGGILALTALVRGKQRGNGKGVVLVLVLLGLFGASLLYGDGMITPAISVLSAVEGTTVVTSSFANFVVPVAVVILVGLFSVQRHGTAKVGRAFGPIMALWFLILGVLGIVNIARDPAILAAVNPVLGVQFIARNGVTALLSLGSVFLVVTGGEALYADMGHFGHRPIARAWYTVCLPGLLLNYFGQGALLRLHPEHVENPFYNLAPRWSLVPLVIIATMATVIASQALISGAFSLTKQAMQMGYLPRMRILQTSDTAQGQIYVPGINWVLLVACVGLVIGFRTSSNLAAAYGLAVTGTMAITTILFSRVAITRFGWPKWRTFALCGLFLTADLAFLSANLPKVPAGGWFPLLVGGILMFLLTTWFAGRAILATRIAERSIRWDKFMADLDHESVMRGPGVGVYLGANPDRVPSALAAHLVHSGVLPATVCVLAVEVTGRPYVDPAEQLTCEELEHRVYRVTYKAGYMDDIDVPAVLAANGEKVCGIDFSAATYVLGRENLRATGRPGMAVWRERVFVFMTRNALTADAFFKLPPARTVEIGVQVEL